jgi:DNA-binding CsgD family transcriptional regulator
MNDLDARILEGVAMGMSTVNLAAKLYLSRQGVEYHVGKMLRRFKVANRAALVSRAYAIGILGAGTWPPRVAPDYVSNLTSKSSA